MTLARTAPWAGVVIALLALPAQAATRAWLDRDRVAPGEAVVLTVESDQGVPDVGPLQRDFDVRSTGRQTGLTVSNGRVRVQTTLRLQLTPRRTGVLLVPPLRVGNDATAAMNVEVAGATAAATSAPLGAAAATRTPPTAAARGPRGELSIESLPDDATPYVQQAVGWTVRLYSALPIMSGKLEQPVPDGASLQRVGDDVQTQREFAGRRYTVVERRYLLVPDRAGALRIPPATFEGRAVANFFEDLFGRQGDTLTTQAPARTMQVRAIPAGAAQPWLPLHGLTLRYTASPQALAANAAGTVGIELTADGATAAQLPTLELPASDGLQVFAEPPTTREDPSGGRPRTVLSRTFSLVPTRSGEVTLPGLRIGWWDVAANRARTASLPPLRWTVAPAPGLPSAPPADVADLREDGANAERGGAAAPRGWVAATVVFALAWLLTLVWALGRRGGARAPVAAPTSAPATTRPAHDGRALRQALDTGDLGDVLDVLRASATPAADSVDALLHRLDDPRQVAAVRDAERARFGGGDGVSARRALREAFAKGPRWTQPAASAPEVLPPLYP